MLTIGILPGAATMALPSMRAASPREALEQIARPNLRSIAEIAYLNPARVCSCANVSLAGGGTCSRCGTYLHGPLCRSGCICSPEAWR